MNGDKPDAARTIGTTAIQVSSVAMGCWPIAGMTSIDVNERDSRATLRAAVERGINFFDTAYCYGPQGESERLIAAELGAVRDQIVIATKGGIEWDEAGQRVFDARPETLIRQCEESLKRLQTDQVDLYYLHAPDPNLDIAESAGAIAQLIAQGKVRAAGVSNVDVAQLRAFQQSCPVAAVQPHYNMLQREIEDDLLPYTQQQQISAIVYWPLMKGLLAGRIQRDHKFDPQDGRAKYPMFRGEEWQKNQDFVDQLRSIAAQIGKTVAQVVINWTIHRRGITVALCGAKRAHQIEETAGAMGWRLSEENCRVIEKAIAARGKPVTRAAV